MTLNLSVPGMGEELKPRITVFGVGGAGGNAVNNMIDKELEGVDFVVANTDAQALQQSRAQARVQLGVKVTEGLGAGAKATVGAAAAEESIEQIVDYLAGAHMCFITAGMGGGTGTGAAPIIAQAARELGVLTVGVVTKPFQFEGVKRMRQAEDGVEQLQKVVDTLIIIPNQNLFRLANEKTTFTEAFSMADDVLYQGVKGVTDLMVRPGLINLDFADVRAVMDEMGKAMMGTGEAEGETRALQAAEKAIANPLLDEISLKGARGVLINITGGHDLTLFELDEAANRIREEVDPDANIIVGSTLDESMEGAMRVSVVATGIDAAESHQEIPVPRRRMAEPLKPAVRAEEEAAPAPVAQQQPAPAPQQPAPQPSYQQQPAARQHGYAPMEEDLDNAPTLFDDLDQPAPAPQRQPAAESYQQPAYNARPEQRAQYEAQDDLPPPAYQPARAEAAPMAHAEEEHDQRESFIAPAPRRAGQPSPETMARLQAAVAKQPRDGGAPRQPQQPAPLRAATPQQAPAAEVPAEKRSRINSLINRMTGQPEGAAHAPQQAQHRAAPAPQPQARVEPQAAPRRAAAEPDPDQERIEIPAFLRRQAN
ncbi:cell division protein FtsZ [Pseudooceanicola antarcticus]|uniref:Cell division protein FtsZ n=1 Tax=Pseudooceanicola antarcticus TaxID=1247613 RepID=A0A285J2W3_9RHOB|nr:cell division protein FtsZ [Pseudooceanicola antarcticus]PJE29723.1 cell division protein FtsZ [Pseudooceanicola antarcticus]SNY54675.1 cell division protein FtsZ [Pseudooceanicola antarcticus]